MRPPSAFSRNVERHAKGLWKQVAEGQLHEAEVSNLLVSYIGKMTTIAPYRNTLYKWGMSMKKAYIKDRVK